MRKDWDELTEAEKVAATLERYRSGHTSVGNHIKQLRADEREKAFDEAITFLAAHGFADASAALEAAAFERLGQ